MALVAVISLILISFAAETNAECRHTLVSQKGLRVNTIENVYVDFHDCEPTVTISATLTSLPERANHHDTVRIEIADHGDRPVKIPLEAKADLIEVTEVGKRVREAELNVRYCFGQGCGAPWKIIPPVDLILNETHGYVFMTTDRPAYRPGEIVRITAALTNQDLKPNTEQRPLKIFIKTPEEAGRIIVDDSKEFFVKQNGFLDYDYKIPDESPVKGVWWAEVHTTGPAAVKMAEKSFVIDTYELPTFQVNLLPNYHFILETMTHIEGEVLAEYSYGEKVNGFYYMTFSLQRPDGSEQIFHRIPDGFGVRASISQGHTEYRVPIEELTSIFREGENIRDLAATESRIVISASVTGFAEAVFESDVVDDIVFTKSPFIIDHSQSAKFFISGTIYAIRATIKDAYSHLPLPDVGVTIEWGRGNREIASDANGEIYHEVDSFQIDVERVTIRTTSTKNAATESEAIFDVEKYVPSRTLGVRVRHQVIGVGEMQNINFDLGNSRPTNIRFFVVSRGRFVYADTKVIQEVQVANGGNRQVTASFRVTALMVPSARVIAYYIHDNDLTSNSAWFDVTNQCETELVITPDPDTVEPGEKVVIELNGAPHATVLAMAVDRAAYFVHNGTRVNREQLWSKMTAYDTGCSRKGGLDATNVFEEAGLSFHSPLSPEREYRHMYCQNARKKRDAPPTPTEEGRITKLSDCFRDGQNQDFREMSCEDRLEIIRPYLSSKGELEEYIEECCAEFYRSCSSPDLSSSLGRALARAGDSAVQVRARKRENFAEKMFFFRRELKANGKDVIKTTATDSITHYEIDAFGMSDHSPMCVAETKSLKIFKNFFIQLYLPYSLKVREQANIRFSIFNYGRRQKQVDVFLRHSEDLCSRLQAVQDFKYLTSLTVEAESATSGTFTILPLRVPKKDAKIALTTGDEDFIERDIRIENEGQHNESSQTIVLQPGEDGERVEKTMIFDIPVRSVMLSTQRCYLYAYAHPMGPSIEIDSFDEKLANMDGLILQPAGCGEQNMIRIGPTVYIHKYRVEFYGNAVTDQQRADVLRHIKEAYNIELKWRSDLVNKEAFAVWNNHKPSTWLNAFVTKVFAAAKEFWPGMDTDPICTALKWLVGTQNSDDGSFTENARVYHTEMRGFVDSTLTLTAYVSISLREAAPACPDITTRLLVAAERANNYLKQHPAQTFDEAYILAMGAYALAVSDPNGREAFEWNEELMKFQRQDEEYIYWKGTRGRAANIETTAYALLAELTLKGITVDNDELTRSVAHWLISQRNAHGGFVSTQDTVVALQALSTYMAILERSKQQASPPTNLNVEIISHKENERLAELILSPDDTMKRTDFDIDAERLAAYGGVTVAVSGDGTGSLAYRCTWRQSSDDGECTFALRVQIDDDGPDDKIMKIFVSKPDSVPSPMVIVDVGILSGYKPDRDSIDRLCNSVDRSADRYEITENTIKFYLTDIDSGGKRLGFKITQTVPVQNRQPASVSVYDYYEPGIRCTKFYTEQEGDYQLQTRNCDGENAELCRCSEGSCPVCRTRSQQLTDTVCSNHNSPVGGQNLCQLARLCQGTRRDCYNLHRKTCDSKYLYVVQVLEVGDGESGSKYFLATVNEVIRESDVHRDALNSIVKFTMRKDCFDSCQDERLARLRASDYINVNRVLMIYGSQPHEDKDQDPPKEYKYVYDLSEGAGMEITLSNAKCGKLLRKNVQNDKLKVCKIKSVLREAHHNGCD